MNHLLFLDGATTAATTPAGGMSWGVMIGYIAIIGGIFYFMAIRPQKKQRKQMDALVSSLSIGDSVLTTSGFYGVVIDVMDDVVIVEFGNNKNCRIPMKKTAVVEIEKPETEDTK